MSVRGSVLERVVVADSRPSVDHPYKGDTDWKDPKQVCGYEFRALACCNVTPRSLAFWCFVLKQRDLAIAGFRRILNLQARLLLLFGAHARRAWDETDGKSCALHGPVAVGAILLWCVAPDPEEKRVPYLLMDQRHPCCVRYSLFTAASSLLPLLCFARVMEQN